MTTKEHREMARLLAEARWRLYVARRLLGEVLNRDHSN